MSNEQIVHEALALPAEKRAQLADQLLASLDSPEQGQLDQAWEEEIERRIDAYEAGQEKSRPIDEVIREIRQRIGRPR
jgi:putative addiction module component (TIGR02574 family)